MSQDNIEPGGLPSGSIPNYEPDDETSIQTRDAARRRLRQLRELRQRVDDEIESWSGILEAAESLLIDKDDRRLALDFSTNQIEPVSSIPRGAIERFGPTVLPVADRMILELGRPVPIEEIFAALDLETRRELESSSQTYSAPFRIRRMFRRNPKYKVTEFGVSFSDEKQIETMPLLVTRLTVSAEGFIVSMTVSDDSSVKEMSKTEIQSALRSGRLIKLDHANGRSSTLKLVGRRIVSEFEGVENSDISSLPTSISNVSRDEDG